MPRRNGHDIKLHESVAALQADTSNLCERTDRIESKVDKIDSRLDTLNGDLLYQKGRIAAIAAVVGASLAHIVSFFLPKSQ